MNDKAMPVFASGMYIKDNGDVVINADEMDAAGVKSVKFIEVKPTEAGSGNYESRIMKLKGDSARGAAVKIAAEADARIAELEAKIDGLWKEIDSHRAHVKHLEGSRDVYEQRAETAETRLASARETIHRLESAELAALAELDEANATIAHLRKAKDCYYDCVDKAEANQRIASAEKNALNIVRPLVEKAEADAAILRQQLADARDYSERAPKLAAEVGNARAEKAEAEAARLQRQINDAVSILSDMHSDEGCQFKGARGKDVGCLACLAQIALNGPAESAEGAKE